MRLSRVLFAVLFVVIATLAMWTRVRAQDYPSRPVTVVVPFAPGGGVDQMARLISGKLEQRLGKSFIIESKPGAGSIRPVDELKAFVKSEIVRWGNVVSDAGIAGSQ